VEIISQVLQGQGFTGGSFAFKCFTKYQPREYCVQYAESDFHFINRLCEEEGIYYYFEHSDGGHCLCFSDMAGGPPIPGESELRFFPGSGEQATTAVIARLNLRRSVRSDASTYREWNFETPSLDLTAQDSETDVRKAPSPGGMRMETYRFPHLYQLRDPGRRYAQIQLLRQLTFSTRIEGESDVSRFTPGFTFGVKYHQRRDVNARWWVTAVEHKGEQPGVLEHEAPDRGLQYNAHFEAIPEMTRFVPELRHPKARVDGLQSAIVTGPSGEEVYCDTYGRVKVQFHWDREGAHDERTSCWVRVADTWAGEYFGFIQIPRIGQEVMVEYMEGDPDRPVITGRVYNANLLPPFELPGQKTLSGIQSREFQAGGRNQLILDDTKGQIQAQISSDHLLSQLNLGYLTRINHVEGRKDFRGEGFELRTDGWGVIRTGNGLHISTFIRSQAEKHQKDVKEAVENLDMAGKQHKQTGDAAETAKAQDHDPDVAQMSDALAQQLDEIKGDGEQKELRTAQLVISSQAGIAATTPRNVHLHSGMHTAVTSERHTSISTGGSLLASATDKVSLFAGSRGMRLMAAGGKVEIEAQSDSLDMNSQKLMQIMSAQDKVRVSSPKEILLTAGGSYIKISESGIEMGTNGDWTAKAAAHKMEGPADMPYLDKEWKSGAVTKNARVIVRDELGRIVDADRQATLGSGDIKNEEKLHPLYLFHNESKEEVDVAVKDASGMQYIQTFGHTTELKTERAVDARQGAEGEEKP
jgi:type VI secretion system secreted protein VgrG